MENPKKEIHLPTTDFQGRFAVSFPGLKLILEPHLGRVGFIVEHEFDLKRVGQIWMNFFPTDPITERQMFGGVQSPQPPVFRFPYHSQVIGGWSENESHINLGSVQNFGCLGSGMKSYPKKWGFYGMPI